MSEAPSTIGVRSWEIPAALDNQRVDRVLALLTGMPRGEVGSLVDSGAVTVRGQAVTSRSRRVHTGDQLTATWVQATVAPLIPDAAVQIPVLWSDSEVAVVDKPAGLVVHPGAGHRSGTMVHGLLARFPQLAAMTKEQGADDRPGIVHRLDKGTSGLLMVALTPAARRSLIAQLAARSVLRRYATLVHGSLGADEGVIDAPIGRSHADATRMAVLASGRPARTRYRVVARYDQPIEATLLECQLESGRTHQVRVHLAAIGHPVVGDERYDTSASPSDPARLRTSLARGRTWLHARVLGFAHPSSGEHLEFSSPLPKDLLAVLAGLTPAEGSVPASWARD